MSSDQIVRVMPSLTIGPTLVSMPRARDRAAEAHRRDSPMCPNKKSGLSEPRARHTGHASGSVEP